MASTPDASVLTSRPPWHIAWAEVVLILLVFAAQAGWPAPEPNEPHYLGKAKHFWDPGWAPDDFFFASADSHRVFYVTIGWLSHYMPLATLAWCGRALTWFLLAWSWRRLSWAVVPSPGWAVLSGLIFLSLNVCCHWAGEWVIGGFEAKGLAYALVFAALAALIGERWNRSWLLLGAASALHVLVGGWSAVAVAWSWLTRRGESSPSRKMLLGIVGGALLAFFGLVPALALNWNVAPAVVVEANDIYVFERLKHHLVPQEFPPWLIARHLLLIIGWLVLARHAGGSPKVHRLGGVVLGALAIEFGGLAISLAADAYPAWSAGLLRLYWFRLSDVMLPVGVALAGVAATAGMARRRWTAVAGWIALCLTLAAYHRQEYAIVRHFHQTPRADKSGKVVNAADWRDACEWVAGHTPADATFLTPRLAQTFTWHAGRGQVASWKDIPQDAAAIVEWWRRINAIHGTRDPTWQGEWYDSLSLRSTKTLRRFGEKYKARYLVTESKPRLALPRLYENNSYAVYELTR
ncbi:MAG TPA: DUF6798 domain-containing protein [Pirellulales bacterium]|nr:DUF6798 domain-containing protein [Pirellulales bacterium]